MTSMAAARLRLWPFWAIATERPVSVLDAPFRFSSQRLVTCLGAVTPLLSERQTHPVAGPGYGAA